MIVAKGALREATRQADYAWYSLWVGGLGAIATAYAAIKAGDAAKSAAKAAAEAVNGNAIAANTANNQLRAYMHVSDANISGASSDESGPTISIGINNFGQTPAHNVIHSFNYCFHLGGNPQLDIIVERRHGDVGPGQNIFLNTAIPIGKWLFYKQNIADGYARLVFFGKITYFDSFDKTTARETEYRFEVISDDDGITDGPLALCQEGNRAT